MPRIIINPLGRHGHSPIPLGGPGSGHHGHKGRPGERGGSQPGVTKVSTQLGLPGMRVKPIVRGATVAPEATYAQLRNYGRYNERDVDRFVRASKHGFEGELTYNELALSHVRGKVKHTIVTELERRSGESYEDCNRVVKQWSYSSNDEDYRSLCLQEAVAEEFGIELSQWQKTKLGDFMTEEEFQELKSQAEKLYEERTTLYEEAGVLNDIRYGLDYDETNPEYVKVNEEYGRVWKKYLDKYADSEVVTRRYENARGRRSAIEGHLLKNNRDPAGAARRILRAMYNNTQARFAKMGIKTIRIFRGYSSFGASGLPFEGARISLRNNAMSSWTSAFFVAESFGSGVLAIDVPVSRILGTCQTGLGCLEEQEFILLGSTTNTDEALVLHSTYRFSKY